MQDVRVQILLVEGEMQAAQGAMVWVMRPKRVDGVTHDLITSKHEWYQDRVK
jgi:hypothetical protein